MYHHSTQTNPKLSNWPLHPENNNKSSINELQGGNKVTSKCIKRNDLPIEQEESSLAEKQDREELDKLHK